MIPAETAPRPRAGAPDRVSRAVRPRGGAVVGWSVAVGVPLAFLAVFFAWPVVSMLACGFMGADGIGLQAFEQVLGERRTWLILGQTVGMAVAGTAGSVLLGIPGAYILYRCRFRGRDALRAVATVPFVLPTVIVGVSFRALLAQNGPLGFLGLDGTTTAVVLAMIFFNYSVVVRMVGSVWAGLDPRTTESARMLGASGWRAFRTVTLPQLTPAITSAAGLVFLFCSTAYGIVQTLGRPGYGTLETEIWVRTTTYLDLSGAAVLSCLQVALVVATLVISGRLRRRTDIAVRMRADASHPLVGADAPAFAVTLAVIVGLLVAPMAALVVRSLDGPGGFGLGNYALLASSSGTGFAGGSTVFAALEHSLKIALDATGIALLIGVPLAFALSRRPARASLVRGQRLLDGAVMMPLGVSAVTVGFGFFISLSGPARELGFTAALVPLAQAVVAIPMVVRSLVPVLRAIDPRLREAAATLGAAPIRVLATIDLPFALRGLGLATGFAFAMSLGEFGATSFLASPDYVTLPVLIARLLGRPGADNYGMAMAASVVLAVITATIMVVCERLRPPGVEGGAW